MKKIITMLLLLAMITSVFGGCGASKGENTGSNTDVSDNSEVSAQETAPEEKIPKEKAPDAKEYCGELYKNNDLDGRTINFIYQSDYYYGAAESEISYNADEVSEDVLAQAVYDRELSVEEGLNVSIVSKNVTAGNGYNEVVRNIVIANDHSLDAVVGYKRYTNNITAEGLCFNLRDIDTISLDKPWWDQNFNKFYSFAKNTRQYMMTGDMLYNDNYTCISVFYNKKLSDAYNLGDPYELVRTGKWTLDTMQTMMTGAKIDLNGDSVYDENDQWGLSIDTGFLAMELASCDLPSVVSNDDGTFALRADVMPDAYVSAAEKIWRIAQSDSTLIAEKLPGMYSTQASMQQNGQFLFWLTAVGNIKNYRSIDDFDFGVLPLPKYDDAQEKYLTPSSPWSAIAVIPKSTEVPKETGLVYEALAAAGADMVTPVAIERQVMMKSTRDADSAEMLGIIFNNVSYDLLFDLDLGGYYGMTTEATYNSSFKFVSSLESIRSAVQDSLKEYVANYENLN